MKNLRNKNIGAVGEELASKYLLARKFKILERNFTKRYGEIDIVGLDGDTLVFVEVKTRMGNRFGTPEESVRFQKLQSLIKSSEYYKLLHPDLPDSLRIDLVAVALVSEYEVDSIRWYKNITG